jgi:hypothetical protein
VFISLGSSATKHTPNNGVCDTCVDSVIYVMSMIYILFVSI